VGGVNLPSIIPSYIYTLFASIIVGALVIGACGVATLNVRNEAEKQQLSNVAEYVSAKSLELINQATKSNVTSTLHLNVPASIGNQRYWIQIANDSTETWVEVGFGTTARLSDIRSSIPSEASTSGTYTSGAGSAILACYSDTAGVHLTISGGN
jgi:hypothetical protein